MARRDYEDDPNAPKPNSLVPAASVVVVDEAGRVLLHRRTDNGMWALPGGRTELGESLAGCGIRETREETGIDIEIIGIVGTYTNPGHVFAYDDGEVRQEFLDLSPWPGRWWRPPSVGRVLRGRLVRPGRGGRAAHGREHPQATRRLAKRTDPRRPVGACAPAIVIKSSGLMVVGL